VARGEDPRRGEEGSDEGGVGDPPEWEGRGDEPVGGDEASVALGYFVCGVVVVVLDLVCGLGLGPLVWGIVSGVSGLVWSPASSLQRPCQGADSLEVFPVWTANCCISTIHLFLDLAPSSSPLPCSLKTRYQLPNAPSPQH
jgi:hypothetical protein